MIMTMMRMNYKQSARRLLASSSSASCMNTWRLLYHSTTTATTTTAACYSPYLMASTLTIKSPLTRLLTSKGFSTTTTASSTVHSATPAATTHTPFTASQVHGGGDNSKLHGSYHWNFERALSLVTVPLIGSAMAFGPMPYVDLALGLVIPIHTHLGFEVIVTDYLQHRHFPIAHNMAKGLLYGATALTMYGLYAFNTNDVGITEFVARLWTGKTRSSEGV